MMFFASGLTGAVPGLFCFKGKHEYKKVSLPDFSEIINPLAVLAGNKMNSI